MYFWIKGKSNGLNQQNLQLSIPFYNFDLKQGVATAGAGLVQCNKHSSML